MSVVTVRLNLYRQLNMSVIGKRNYLNQVTLSQSSTTKCLWALAQVSFFWIMVRVTFDFFYKSATFEPKIVKVLPLCSNWHITPKSSQTCLILTWLFEILWQYFKVPCFSWELQGIFDHTSLSEHYRKTRSI